MRIVILWTGVSGYMTACWRCLSAVPGVQLKVFIEEQRNTATGYDRSVLQGFDHELRYADEPLDQAGLRNSLLSFDPDLLVIVGWRSPMCRFVGKDKAFHGIPRLLVLDLPFQLTARKFLARFVLWPYLRHFAGVVVPGERALIYARYLGFSEANIETGLFGVDTQAVEACERVRRREGKWPRRFLFVGRYAKEKRIDHLVAAYRNYRARVQNPWSLTVCGMGPLKELFEGEPGVVDRGFVQPTELPSIYAHHGAFVIASAFDPWPLVIVEAAASGLPIICTRACGSHVEVVRPYDSGLVCPTADVKALSDALLWAHEHEGLLPEMGHRGAALAAPYGAERWAFKWSEICRRYARRQGAEKAR